ncbi:hypothetical protein ONZ45_g14386 [Pleurotus djamor]|nr:hypothetical protein ONZ45_g14386 [Pleurotus djamor]
MFSPRWIPRQPPVVDPDDLLLLKEEPIRSNFQNWRNAGQYQAGVGRLVSCLSTDPIWRRRIKEWFSLCTKGAVLSSQEMTLTFVNVLWLRYTAGTEEEMLTWLEEAQTTFWNLPAPTKTNTLSSFLPVDEDESEEEDTPGGSSKDYELSDLDLEGMVLIEDLTEALLVHWTKKTRSFWLALIRGDPIYQRAVCDFWVSSIHRFFVDEASEEDIKDLKVVVTSLQQMRAITKNIWTQVTFSTAIQLIPNAINPTAIFFLVTFENFVGAWKRWLKYALAYYGFQVDDVDLKSLHREFRGLSLNQRFFKDRPWMHPDLVVILQETQVLVDRKKGAVQHVLRPSVSHDEPKPSRARLSKACWRRINKAKKQLIPPLKPPRLHTTSSVNGLSATSTLNEAPGLSTEKDQTKGKKTKGKKTKGKKSKGTPAKSKKKVKDHSKFEFLPFNITHVNKCVQCRDQSPNLQCVKIINVERQDDLSNLVGDALTCAPPGNQPKQKVSSNSPYLTHIYFDFLTKSTQETKNAASHTIKFHNPDKLGMQPIASNRDILDRCGTDVYLLVHKKVFLVGMVKFNAFDQETLDDMLDHQLHSEKIPNLTRAKTFESFAYGSMKAMGSRQPQGGRAGDGYQPYAAMSANTKEDIQRLFQHARVGDVMWATAQKLYPPVTSRIGLDTIQAGVNSMGTVGGNLYICKNFMSPIHFDEDIGISLNVGASGKEVLRAKIRVMVRIYRPSPGEIMMGILGETLTKPHTIKEFVIG